MLEAMESPGGVGKKPKIARSTSFKGQVVRQTISRLCQGGDQERSKVRNSGGVDRTSKIFQVQAGDPVIQKMKEVDCRRLSPLGFDHWSRRPKYANFLAKQFVPTGEELPLVYMQSGPRSRKSSRSEGESRERLMLEHGARLYADDQGKAAAAK